MKIKLSDQRIQKLAPAAKEYVTWDNQLYGFGIRVKPSGYKAFILQIDVQGKSRKATLGRFPVVSEVQARQSYFKALAQLGLGEPVEQEKLITPRFDEFTKGIWWEQKFTLYKPSGQRSTESYINSRLMPKFSSLFLHEIDKPLVAKWFDEYSKVFPGGANRSLEILLSILEFAIVCGHLEENKARGIRKNPKKILNRFLSSEEINRVSDVLARLELKGVYEKQCADIVRLLLLTGCRHREICHLKWDMVRGNVLKLPDTKTGPREVYLSEKAVAIIKRQPRNKSGWLFLQQRYPNRPRNDVSDFWRQVRKLADIEDVRVHDLRHTYASHAVMKGVTIPMVSKLLGHRKTSMTLRYTHVTDKETAAAAERVGLTLQGLLGGLVPEVPEPKPEPKSIETTTLSIHLNEAEQALAKRKAKTGGMGIGVWFASKLKVPPEVLPPPSKWGLRPTKVSVTTTKIEHQQYKAAAKAAGLSLACWIRTVVLEAERHV